MNYQKIDNPLMKQFFYYTLTTKRLSPRWFSSLVIGSKSVKETNKKKRKIDI